MGLSTEQAAQSFVPAHPDLPHAGGVAAQVGSESYVEALAPLLNDPDRGCHERAYVPAGSILDDTYRFPDVVRTQS
jgi:hypothetical protein